MQLPNSLEDHKKVLNSYEKNNNGNYGFWKAFYIVGYKTSTN